MAVRVEHDSMGNIEVAEEALWGAQTERSRRNFNIGGGHERMPEEVIYALAVIKKAAAKANARLMSAKMTSAKAKMITDACDVIISGGADEHFPLSVFQTGSGTQTNMNVNEVIAHIGNGAVGENILHPNDDVNMSQSSNDVFPAAMHLAALGLIENRVKPAVSSLIGTLERLEAENADAVKCGRTHLQDALPVSFAQEISGWRSSLEKDLGMLTASAQSLCALPLGGTAVGTGANCPKGFDKEACAFIAEETGLPVYAMDNKFHGLTSKSELVYTHGALRAMACDLMKIANDIRFLASGPRLGYGEISIPANEPGSSIMPGKVNPTQCEAMTMCAVQIMGNDAAIGIAASQGNFELNVFMPLIIYDFTQSCRLLADTVSCFDRACVSGIKANREKMRADMEKSLMLATALSPHIGYENAAKVVKEAYSSGLTLREACLRLGFLAADEFDRVYHPENMI